MLLMRRRFQETQATVTLSVFTADGTFAANMVFG